MLSSVTARGVHSDTGKLAAKQKHTCGCGHLAPGGAAWPAAAQQHAGAGQLPLMRARHGGAQLRAVVARE